MSKTIAVIPARYASTRFPGKPLALILGKPMIQWVYERTAAASRIDEVLVATDDQRIAAAVRSFGGAVCMTKANHPTGTDRIAEAVAGSDADLVLNVQGDEPLIDPVVLDQLVAVMRNGTAAMGTVAVPLRLTGCDPNDPNVVKVVTDAAGNALYFSRAPIPFDRDQAGEVQPLQHWGLYAFRRAFLAQFIRWPQGRLEKCECLEQLRALEHGAQIAIVQVEQASIGVDVPADIARAEAKLVALGYQPKETNE